MHVLKEYKGTDQQVATVCIMINLRRKCQTPSKRSTDGRTDGQTPWIIFGASVRPSVRVLDGVWH